MHDPAIGDRVVTNNLDWGTIEGPCDYQNPREAIWYNVILDKGGREMQDASRMSRRHPFGDPDPRKAN